MITQNMGLQWYRGAEMVLIETSPSDLVSLIEQVSDKNFPPCHKSSLSDKQGQTQKGFIKKTRRLCKSRHQRDLKDSARSGQHFPR